MFDNNGGGNPNHASDGKFTSGANQAGNKVENKENYESQIKEKLGIKNDVEPSFEEKMQNMMGIKNAEVPQEKKNSFVMNAENELAKQGSTIVGENRDETIEVTMIGDKYYAKGYKTNFDGPVSDTEYDIEFEGVDDGFDSLEEIIGALKKDGYPVYDGFDK